MVTDVATDGTYIYCGYGWRYIIKVLDEEGNEVQMSETLDDAPAPNVNALMNDKKFDNNESFESAGYRETTVEGLDDDSNIAD